MNRKKYMSCNKPQKSWRPGKKKVVKACSMGKEKLIHLIEFCGLNNIFTLALRNCE